MSKIQISDITVRPDRVICIVNVGEHLFSNADAKNKLLEKLPTLADHKCKNSCRKKFVDIMDSTSVAHLLEHVIIDYQIKNLENTKFSEASIFGTTEWINKDSGIARIEVSYCDDIIALKSIKQACSLLNSTL